MLNELINDSGCRLVGSSCGENMVLEIFSKLNGSCVDKCVCAYNSVENDIGCVKCDWEEEDVDDADDNNDDSDNSVNDDGVDDNAYLTASFSLNIFSKFTT